MVKHWDGTIVWVPDPFSCGVVCLWAVSGVCEVCIPLDFKELMRISCQSDQDRKLNEHEIILCTLQITHQLCVVCSLYVLFMIVFPWDNVAYLA